jgi:hypothetical protein
VTSVSQLDVLEIQLQIITPTQRPPEFLWRFVTPQLLAGIALRPTGGHQLKSPKVSPRQAYWPSLMVPDGVDDLVDLGAKGWV